jgi:hypothetical protein
MAKRKQATEQSSETPDIDPSTSIPETSTPVKEKKTSKWIEALKIYNKDGKYRIPLRGSVAYDEVRELMKTL